jgi:hypothetical protein
MTAGPPAASAGAIEISVVVPTYACATCLHALHERLSATLGAMAVEYELVFVDDRAQDGSWDVLAQLAAADPRVRAFRMSRNFGQHMAITAGVAEAAGAWVVVMDCDLQDPPEEIPRLYAKAREGHDIVLARRLQRQGARVRDHAGRLYFRLLNLVAGTAIDRTYGTFSIISRQVATATATTCSSSTGWASTRRRSTSPPRRATPARAPTAPARSCATRSTGSCSRPRSCCAGSSTPASRLRSPARCWPASSSCRTSRAARRPAGRASRRCCCC